MLQTHCCLAFAVVGAEVAAALNKYSFAGVIDCMQYWFDYFKCAVIFNRTEVQQGSAGDAIAQYGQLCAGLDPDLRTAVQFERLYTGGLSFDHRVVVAAGGYIGDDDIVKIIGDAIVAPVFGAKPVVFLAWESSFPFNLGDQTYGAKQGEQTNKTRFHKCNFYGEQ